MVTRTMLRPRCSCEPVIVVRCTTVKTPKRRSPGYGRNAVEKKEAVQRDQGDRERERER